MASIPIYMYFESNYRNIIEIRYKKNKRYFCFNITTMELSTTVLEKKGIKANFMDSLKAVYYISGTDF
jgi:hypothetical protein